jgi:hypothetical protein
MSRILWIIAIILIIGWLVGFIGFGDAVGTFIHALLVVAVIIILYNLLARR